MEMEVDIEALELRYGGETIPVKMPEGARGALVSGQWDFLTQLLENGDQIRETAATLPYMTGFAG